MKNKIAILIFLLSSVAFAQEKIFHGKIQADGNNVEGINIVNLVNEKSTVSDANGEFRILAKPEDLLVLSAINFEYKRKIVIEEDLNAKEVPIKMIPKIGQIDEVVIVKNKNLDAVALGILDRPAKQYTPAERKLKTAGDFKPIHLLGILGGQLQIDPILNAINGKTKRLKTEINVEKREMLLAQLDDVFSDEYYVQSLKIAPENIKGFQFLAIEDEEIVARLKQKNKTYLSLRMIQLAEKYHKVLANEK